MSAQHGQGGAGRREPTLRRTVLEDLRRVDLGRTFRRELQELHHFYLSEERRERLASMGRLRRTVWFCGWLLKSLLLKLSPARRLILLAAAAALMWGDVRFGNLDLQLRLRMDVVGLGLVLLVLMLELKDKLLARDEIEIARQVQISLLPRRHPRPAGWSLWSQTRPANDVGGDLIDYIELDRDRLGVVLADVAGKGLGAALLMANLQATLRATVSGGAPLDDLGARLNAILLRDGLDNRFATLFYLELADGSARLRYLNAGHHPPLVARAGRVQALPASCLPLGISPEARFAEETLQLEPGDLLLAYSDGLTEARNAGQEEFGSERLAGLLPPLRGLSAPEAGGRLMEAVEDFLGEARPHDDLSLVVLARHGVA